MDNNNLPRRQIFQKIRNKGMNALCFHFIRDHEICIQIMILVAFSYKNCFPIIPLIIINGSTIYASQFDIFIIFNSMERILLEKIDPLMKF